MIRSRDGHEVEYHRGMAVAPGMRLVGPIAACLLAVWAGAFAPRVHGQAINGAGGFGFESGARESHAWLVLPASRRAGVQLFHVPPRGGGGSEPGIVADGAAPMVRVFEKPPEAIAAWDARVFLVFPPELARPGRVQRRVLSLRAARTALGDSWAYQDPGAARLDALPPIPGQGDLLGFVGSARGPTALINDPARGGVTLLLLGERGWARAPLPGSDGDGPPVLANERVRLVATDRGVGVLPGARPAGIWIGEFIGRPKRPPPPSAGSSEELGEAAGPEAAPVADGGPPAWPADDAPSWTWTPLPLGDVPDGDGAAHWIRGRLVLTRWARGRGLVVWSVDSSGAHRLAQLKECPASYAVAPLEHAGRLVVMWAVREPPKRSPPQPAASGDLPEYRYRIVEVSAQSGRVLYDAAWTATSPISPKEFRGLVLLLAAVLALIVLFVARPRLNTVPLALPQGLALAEPSRRLAAAFLDLLPSVILASQISGVPLGDAFTLSALVGDSGALLLVGDALGVAWAHTTICEWLFGQSLGKSLVGCEVGRMVMARDAADGQLSPEFRKLSLPRAAIRNLVKWGVPPVALFGLGTPEHRHAGDAAAGAAVVVRYGPAAPEGDPPGEA